MAASKPYFKETCLGIAAFLSTAALLAKERDLVVHRQTDLKFYRVEVTVPSHFELLPDGLHVKKVETPKTIKYWQAFSENDPLVPTVPQADRSIEIQKRLRDDDLEKRGLEPLHGGGCPPGMVRIKGTMIDWHEVITKQALACEDKNWSEGPCDVFNPQKLDYKKGGKGDRALDFCIDRYEYPNIRGENPAIMINWVDAQSLCAAEDERLCTEDEWTFSCEGEEGYPYPYGYRRDPKKCVIDRLPVDAPPLEALENDTLQPDSEKTGKDLALAWAGSPSGSQDCVSPWGVYDMTGNVDEFTVWTPGGRTRNLYTMVKEIDPESKEEVRVRKPINPDRDGKPRGWYSILKGGYWKHVRTRCQPSTSEHEPNYFFYQEGFRCCKDSN